MAYSRSPRTCSGARLVARTWRSGHRPSSAAIPGSGASKLLEVVQDQQQPPLADGRDERVEDRAARVSADAERGGDRRRDQVRVADRRKVDEDDAVRKSIRERRADFEGNPGLAVPAGPGERDETVGREERFDLGELAAPSDDGAQLPRKASPPAVCPRSPSLRGFYGAATDRTKTGGV